MPAELHQKWVSGGRASRGALRASALRARASSLLVLGDARGHCLTLLQTLQSRTLVELSTPFAINEIAHRSGHVELVAASPAKAIGTGLVEKRKVKGGKTRIPAAHFATS